MGTVLSEDQIRFLNRLRPPGTATSAGLGTMLDQALAGMLPVDTIGDTEIDWGTGAGQVSAADVPVADAGTYFTTDNVEAALQQIIAERNATGDGVAGADYTGMTAIASIGSQATVQEVVEALTALLVATTYGASGANFLGAYAISGWAGADVQSILEAAKVYVDAQPKVIGYWFSQDGDLTASVAASPMGTGHAAGAVTKAVFTLGNTGADGTDDLALEGDVLINGVTVFSVKPALTKAAADGAWTESAGTGVTVGVIDTAADDVVQGDILTAAFTLTRTTPEDEMADLYLYVEITYPAP